MTSNIIDKLDLVFQIPGSLTGIYQVLTASQTALLFFETGSKKFFYKFTSHSQSFQNGTFTQKLTTSDLQELRSDGIVVTDSDQKGVKQFEFTLVEDESTISFRPDTEASTAFLEDCILSATS